MNNEIISERGCARYVDLPAIVAGTFVALAISIVLLQFGGAVGLTFESDRPWEANTSVVRMMSTGLWLLWVQVLASMVGGYLVGRLRTPVTGSAVHEREVRDGAHGLIVWAAGTVAVVVGVSIASALAAFVADVTDTAAPLAQDLVDRQEHAAIIIAFLASATSLVAAVASWWAATMGGEHRDENVDHSHYVSFRKR